MKPIELACYCLLASAFMLGGLLVVNVRHGLENEAQAEMVIARDAYTVMTARTKNDEEAVFVLNNISSRLVIYKLDVAKKQLILAGGSNLSGGGGGGGDGRTGGGR